jgi:eukaryotic-like serine/threonine-protein kinase
VSAGLIKFDEFALDCDRYELLRSGDPVKLEKLPMELLILLVQKENNLVTRQEIITRLWGDDTFVDTEHGINTAVRKIRTVLRDDPEQPRFVQTVTGKGYRFIAPITNGNGAAQEVLIPVSEPLPHGSYPGIVPLNSPTVPAIATPGAGLRGAQKGSRFRWPVVTIATSVIVGLVVASVWWFFLRKTYALTEKDTIVIADFNNATGDPVFDGTLRQGLAVELEQSPFLSLVSDRQIHQTLQMMKLRPETQLTPSISQEICQRINGAIVLGGSITQIGGEFSLILRAEACLNGESIASTKAQAQDKTHVLEALGRASYEMRKKLGESLATVEKFNTPLEQATTSSLEALRAYDLGYKTGERGDFVAAIPWFQKAVGLDPSFAMAYCLLGMMQQNLGQKVFTRNLKKGYDLRSTVSERERLYIEFEYYAGTGSGDLENAQRAGALWAQTYPRDCAPRGELGFLYQGIEETDRALEWFREAHRLCPDESLIDAGLIDTYSRLDRLGEAHHIASEAMVKNSDSLVVREALYELAFLQNDTVGMQAQAAFGSGKPGLEDRLLFDEGNSAAYYGHMKKARELSQQAVASAQRAREFERAAADAALAAEREASVGNKKEARRQLIAALRLPSAAQGTAFLAPLVLAELGDQGAMKPLADKYRKANPDDPYVRFIQMPSLTAWIALSRNEPAKAIATLRPTPYESRFALSPNAYQRGLSYLANHQGKEAATEFQSVLDHPGIVGNSPEGALAHLQMGRACAMQGDIAKARVAYQDFLTLWKDADGDIPILKQAKAEYAKLQ